MTRPAKSSRRPALATLFAADAQAAVLRVLQENNGALAPGDVKNVLRAAGVAPADADRGWTAVQKKVRRHPHVAFAQRRYRWTADVPAPAPLHALELLAEPGLTPQRTAELVEIVRAALATGRRKPDREVAGRQRQTEIDGRRALAELASEVEELAVNGVDATVLIRSVRAWVGRSGLEPVERAGAETCFDRRRHTAIGPPIRDGASVAVVRPGYIWKAPAEDVLLGKAIVEE